VEQKHFVILLFFSSWFCSHGQDFGKALQGMLRSVESDISNVHVLNTSTGKTTITDDDGNFFIAVRLNDTLLFSAVQFKRKLLVVNSSILSSKIVYISLEEFTNELDEVVVRPFDLSGDITQDMKNMEVGSIITETTLKLPNAHVKPPTQNERKLYTARTWDFKLVSIKLDPLINYFSGRTKMLKKRVARDRKAAELDQLYNSFADSLFIYGLGIPKTNIYDFIYFCEVDSNFIALAISEDKIKIWDFLHVKSAVYKENNNLD